MNFGIVLSNEAQAGFLSQYSKERIEAGSKLLNTRLVDSLILSGGIRRRKGFREKIGDNKSFAKIMEDYALRLGVEKRQMRLEDLSEDTVGQLIFLKQIYGKNINGAIIITHDWHAQRTMIETQEIFGKDYHFSYFILPSKILKESIEANKNSLDAFYKTFNGVDFSNKALVLDTLLLKHPLYNHDQKFYREELKKMIPPNLP